jgi:two-component system, cell cycle sensor histidine kinase and response regulator CckA
MSSLSRSFADSARASELIAALEREVAELRRQLAIVCSQVPDLPLRAAREETEEQQAAHAEARYRALIEMTPLAVWITDTKGRSVYGNRYWHEFSGMTMEQTAGWGWMNALHPEDAGKLTAEWVGSTTLYEAELRYRRASDGQYRWHLCRTLPLKDADGNITKWLGFLVDIHDRKIAESAIAEANQRMLLAVEAAEAGTWDYYPQTGKSECSERWHKIFQVPPDPERSRQTFFSRIHPRDRKRINKLIDEALDPKIAADYAAEFRVVLPDGAERWIFAKGKCFFNGEGAAREPVRFSGIVMDVTERKETARERISLTAALQNSPDFIGITDLKGRVLFLNRAGQKMVGLRDDAEARSKTAYDFLGAEERVILDEEIVPAVLDGKVWEREYCMRHFVTREPILVETRVFGIYDETGRLTSMANVSRDISAKKRLEEQLRLAQKMEAVGRLAGGMAHDFNNLLTVIRSAAEVLQERCLKDPANLETVREISGAAERASSLTQQLLAFGKRQMACPRAINLNQVIARMYGMLTRLAGEDITLETKLENGLWNVKMDPIQVDQILINLAANARDAMPHGGLIKIHTFNCHAAEGANGTTAPKAGDYTCLSFSDNGHGMDRETLSRIFEPFFTTKENTQGTGLGLSTVYGIVHQSGGEIAVRSELGEGASFTVYIPRTLEDVLPEDSGTESEPAPGSETILLVEDEPSLRSVLSGYMRERGYRLYEAGDAQEALDIARKNPIDLLLTDIVMPGISGPELAAEMAAARPQMRVVFMSGYAEHAALQDALLLPNALFLEKPFRLSGLIRKVNQALSNRKPAEKMQ